MSRKSTKAYDAPEVTTYGSVESITQQNKIGFGDDVESDGTPLQGAIVDAGSP